MGHYYAVDYSMLKHVDEMLMQDNQTVTADLGSVMRWGGSGPGVCSYNSSKPSNINEEGI